MVALSIRRKSLSRCRSALSKRDRRSAASISHPHNLRTTYCIYISLAHASHGFTTYCGLQYQRFLWGAPRHLLGEGVAVARPQWSALAVLVHNDTEIFALRPKFEEQHVSTASKPWHSTSASLTVRINASVTEDSTIRVSIHYTRAAVHHTRSTFSPRPAACAVLTAWLSSNDHLDSSAGCWGCLLLL
jgi:hypothetical protein